MEGEVAASKRLRFDVSRFAPLYSISLRLSDGSV